MELTNYQKDAVYTEIFEMFSSRIIGLRESIELSNLISDDVIEDIESTADWSLYNEDEYNSSDVSLAIYRTLKSRLEKRL